ncbi:MFS transporter [Patescibacteria group bacterium]
MTKKEKRALVWNRRTIAWYLYDFANSFLFINLLLYFALWVVEDNGVQDIWYSTAFIASTIILIGTAPYLGVVADRKGMRKQFLISFTIVMIVSGGLIQLFGNVISSTFLKVLLALIAFAGWNISYQLSLFVYNTFLKDIAKEEVFGKVSGIGLGMGALGSMLGIVATLPIVNGSIEFLGTGHINVFLPAACVSLLLSIPMLVIAGKTRNHVADEESGSASQSVSYVQVYRDIWHDLRNAGSFPGASRLLLAFYFFSNGILTLQLFAAILVKELIKANDSFTVVIFQVVTVGILLGAWTGGWFSDRFGHKRVLVGTLTVMMITVIGFSVFTQPQVYLVMFGLFGLSLGSTWAVTRALYAQLIPYKKKGQFFGLYTLSERFASIIGPAVWGLIIFVVPSENSWNYRVAVIAMALFIVVGLLILRKLKPPVGAPNSVEGKTAT